jgi:Trypsin-co-occurring domain 1
MATIRPYTIQDGDETYTVYIETHDADILDTPSDPVRGGRITEEDESYGGPLRGNRPSPSSEQAQLVQLHEINQTIRNYSRFIIGAFKGLSGAEIQELNFKFGIKMGGKVGIPVLSECSAEGNFEVEVKCTFAKE